MAVCNQVANSLGFDKHSISSVHSREHELPTSAESRCNLKQVICALEMEHAAAMLDMQLLGRDHSAVASMYLSIE